MCLAVPGRVLSISDDEPLFRTARVDFGGVVKVISLACTPDAGVDDYVLVHAGMAIAVVDQTAAAETLNLLRTVDS